MVIQQTAWYDSSGIPYASKESAVAAELRKQMYADISGKGRMPMSTNAADGLLWALRNLNKLQEAMQDG